MTWAMELSPGGFAEMLMDLSYMDRKTGMAWLRLLGYLRRFGSVPSGEVPLADVLGVSVAFLRKRAWPHLEVRLELSDDKRRYVSPDVTRTDRTQTKAAVPPEITEVRRAAARSSHEKRRSAGASSGASPGPDFAPHGDANGVQNPANGLQKVVQMAAKWVAKSTPVASGLQNFAGDFAGEVAHAPIPTLASFPSSQPTESLEESKEESLGQVVAARAGAGATDLQTTLQTDANDPAKPRANRSPGRSRMTEDWQPPAAVSDFCVNLLGYDLTETLEAFRDHFLANGETKLDWGAALRGWCRRKMEFEAQRRQMPLVRTIGGNGAQKPDKGAFVKDQMAEILARRAARNGDDDSPIIEGMVG